jgi:hypothetical protein
MPKRDVVFELNQYALLFEALFTAGVAVGRKTGWLVAAAAYLLPTLTAFMINSSVRT